MSFTIRPASAADVRAILSLITELAIYEREPDAVVATEEDLLREGFGEGERSFRALVAEVDGVIAGFALYFFSFSTWRGRRCLYLEDLFVRPSRRGTGIGLGLMRELAREATRLGCARFTWQVLDWNEPAIAFYEKLGASVQREWLTVRIEGEALERLASV